ncbi:hypothetical protein D3C86_1404780 [compost metagenome]
MRLERRLPGPCLLIDDDQHLFPFLGCRDLQFVAHPLRRDLHPHAHQGPQRIGQIAHVLGLGHVKLQARAAARPLEALAVQGKQRIDQIPGQRRGELAKVRIPHLLAHLVMHVAERIGRALAVGLAGQGAPQDGLAHGALAPVHHHHKGIGLAIGCVLELDLHPPGDDAARVVANGEHRLQQGRLLLLGGPFRVFAQTHRQAVDLQELGQIPHAVVLEQEGPDQGADKAGAGQIAGFRLGLVHDPAERIEGSPLLAAVPQP